jgi:hypothetical protein
MAMSYLHLYRFVFAGEQPDAYKGHYRNRARHLIRISHQELGKKVSAVRFRRIAWHG